MKGKKSVKGQGQQGTTYTEEVLSGKGIVYLQEERSPSYQVRIWVQEEKKYVRKSLKTTDRDTAIIRAEEMCLKLLSEVASGKKIFGITLEELVTLYLDYRLLDVERNKKSNGQEGITKERWGTIKSQLNALLRIKPPSMKISEFEPLSLYEYREMRFQDNPDVSVVTVRNETATINAMFKFAYPKYSHFPKLEFRKIETRGEIKKQLRRGTFTPDEFKRITDYFRTWCSKKDCPDEEVRIERQTIRDFILILSNTCLRVGELRQMRWSDVVATEKGRDASGLDVNLITLKVRSETSKTRTSRTIITRGGEYFKRVRTYSKFIGKDDYIFPNALGTNHIDERKMYPYWYDLMEKTGFPDYEQRKLTFYSLRHYAITLRLKDLSIWEVSRLAGTGVNYIQDHYGHETMEDKKLSALKYSQRDRTSISNAVNWDD